MTKKNKFQTYANRQKEKGLTKITVWVPIDEEANVKAYCERKRKKHAKESQA